VQVWLTQLGRDECIDVLSQLQKRIQNLQSIQVESPVHALRHPSIECDPMEKSISRNTSVTTLSVEEPQRTSEKRGPPQTRSSSTAESSPNSPESQPSTSAPCNLGYSYFGFIRHLVQEATAKRDQLIREANEWYELRMEEIQSQFQCTLCYDALADCQLQCHHQLCSSCIEKIDSCPWDRSPITHFTRIIK
jgi:hypothetical protein